MASQTSASSPSIRPQHFGPPTVPDTPSRCINKLLKERFGKTFDSKPKFMVAQAVCSIFKVISLVYNQIYKESQPSKNMWMAACGLVAVAISLMAFIVYSVVVGSAFLLHTILYYGCVGVGVAGIGLCVAGVVYFDKDPAYSQGFESPKEQ